MKKNLFAAAACAASMLLSVLTSCSGESSTLYAMEEPDLEPSYTLKADTLMAYAGTDVQMLLTVTRVTKTPDGKVTEEKIAEEVIDILHLDTEVKNDFITRDDKVEENVIWKGIDHEPYDDKAYEQNGIIVTEKSEDVVYLVSAISNHARPSDSRNGVGECDLNPKSRLTVRNVKFYDEKSGKSLEYTFNCEVKYEGYEIVDEKCDNFVNVNGEFEYAGTHVVKCSHILNGYNFATGVVKTRTYDGAWRNEIE